MSCCVTHFKFLIWKPPFSTVNCIADNISDSIDESKSKFELWVFILKYYYPEIIFYRLVWIIVRSLEFSCSNHSWTKSVVLRFHQCCSFHGNSVNKWSTVRLMSRTLLIGGLSSAMRNSWLSHFCVFHFQSINNLFILLTFMSKKYEWRSLNLI